jgi:hypothetical protein
MEVKLQIPETAHFKGLDKPEIYYKSEVGFLKFIALPLFELGNEFMKQDLKEIIVVIESTKAYYEKCLEDCNNKQVK